MSLQAHREGEGSTEPDDHLQPGECEADRMILDQPICPNQRPAVTAKYGRPGRVDRSRAPLHGLADRHDIAHPRNRDGEAEEAEDQASRAADRQERAGVLSNESHGREPSLASKLAQGERTLAASDACPALIATLR